MAFRENLLHLRAANNMTQENLAVLVGVSRQSVAKWESGKAYPEMDKLIKLSQIFDCSLDELIQGDVTDREASSEIPVQSTPQDLFGYDELMRVSANKISNGCMSILLGVAFGVLFFCTGASESFMANIGIGEAIFNAIGVIFVLVGVAISLAYIIPAGMAHNEFVREHPYLQDFYSKSEKQAARKSFANQLIAGICTILLGVCLVIVLAAIPQTQPFGPFALLICIAIGVRLIVHGGIKLSRVDIATYNESAYEALTDDEIEGADVPEERRSTMLRCRKVDKRIGAWCGVIMIIATIIALLMLFLSIDYQTGQPSNDTTIALFWLPWPIGGLICGVVTMIIKATSIEEQ